MQIDCQIFLSLAEKAGAICFFDIEASGLRADYNSILVATVKPWHGKPVTFSVDTPGADGRLVGLLQRELGKYPVWVSYYGKGYDIKMIRTRALRWGIRPIELHHHLDLYFISKESLLLARRSMAHLSEFLESPMQKYSLPPEVWNLVLRDPKKGIKILRKRCESDCAELEDAYDKIKVVIRNVTR